MVVCKPLFLLVCVCNFVNTQLLRSDESTVYLSPVYTKPYPQKGKAHKHPTKHPTKRPNKSKPATSLVNPQEIVAEHNVSNVLLAVVNYSPPPHPPLTHPLTITQQIWRSEVGVQPLGYSTALAASAQAWATQLQQTNNCNMRHSESSPTNNVGENLFWASGWSNGPPQTITSTEVVDAWGNEKQYYDYASNTCGSGQVCGHYTQVLPTLS